MESLFFNEIISTINIANGKTEQFCIPLEHRIYVLEDIDCQSDIVMERTLKKSTKLTDNNLTETINRQSPNQQSPNQQSSNQQLQNQQQFIDNSLEDDNSHKIDLSFLLNLLDGILETPGRIIILTSNHPKLLDHALVRPGRIDVIADFKKCDNKTIIEMIEYFYDISLNNEEIETISKVSEYIVSPAEMGKIMFENFSDYKYAIKKVIELDVDTSKNDINNDSDIKNDIESENKSNNDSVSDNVSKNMWDINQMINNEEAVVSMASMPYSSNDLAHFSWDNSVNEHNYSTF